MEASAACRLWREAASQGLVEDQISMMLKASFQGSPWVWLVGCLG